MRFLTPIASIALLATTTLALPTATTKRATLTNADAVSSLEADSAQMVSTLTSANSQLQSFSASSNPPNGGIIANIISILENNIVEAITLFENISQEGSTADAATIADSMQTELTSLKTEFTTAQTQLNAVSSSGTSPISVTGIETLLGDLTVGVSDYFNTVVDLTEMLGLPPL